MLNKIVNFLYQITADKTKTEVAAKQAASRPQSPLSSPAPLEKGAFPQPSKDLEPATIFGKYISNKFSNYPSKLKSEIKFVETEIRKIFKDSPDSQLLKPSITTFRAFQSHCLNDQEYLKPFYLRLIIASIDPKTADLIHPCFPGILEQLSFDEIKFLNLLTEKNFLYYHLLDVILQENQTKCSYLCHNFSFLQTSSKQQYLSRVELFPNYIDNLLRTGIIRILVKEQFLDRTICELLKQQVLAQRYKNANQELLFIPKIIEITDLGQQFIKLILE